MYAVNGIDLTGTEYREIRDLVELESDEERMALADRALHPYRDKELWNPNGIAVYKRLASLGLIEGVPLLVGFLFHGTVTQKGIDFVQDYADKARKEEGAIRSSRRHDWLIASFGICGGLVSGAFGSALFDLIVGAAARL